MEFLESHATDKAIWNNDTLITSQIEERNDSETDDNESSAQDDDENETKNKEEEKEKKQKTANKVISDLEVILNADTLLFFCIHTCINDCSVSNSTWNP